jgi:uncharacterized protein YndB with AHSA1/START domain
MQALNDYCFTTDWVLGAPIEAVWDVMVASEQWPEWWPYLDSVIEIAKGNFDGTGSLLRFTWGGSLPYKLSFQIMMTQIVRPSLIEGRISGDLEGIGYWLLSEEGFGSTHVRYLLKVRTTKPWMNLVAPLARWYFAWNHNRVMEAGGKGLANHLGARLLVCKGV